MALGAHMLLACALYNIARPRGTRAWTFRHDTVHFVDDLHRDDASS